MSSPKDSGEVAEDLFRKCITIIDLYRKEYGVGFSTEVAAILSGNLIGACVDDVLHTNPDWDASKAETAKYVNDNYKETKKMIEESIGQVFGLTMTRFSGHEVEYYCSIKILPVQGSKLLC